MIYIVRTYSIKRGQTGIFVTIAPNATEAIEKVKLWIMKSYSDASLSDKCVAESPLFPERIYVRAVDEEIVVIP